MQKQWNVAIALGVSIVTPVGAYAGPTSQVEFSFSEIGFTTAFTSPFNPGNTSQITESFDNYLVGISMDSDNRYGQSPLGANPFISMSVQVSNVGGLIPSHPITIGMSITGLTSAPGTDITFESSFTSITIAGGTSTFLTTYDPSNAFFGAADPLSTANGPAKTSFDYDQILTETVSSTYSMSQFITFNPVLNSHPTLDSQLTVDSVPEPASAMIVGAGLAGLGILKRRKKRAVPSE